MTAKRRWPTTVLASVVVGLFLAACTSDPEIEGEDGAAGALVMSARPDRDPGVLVKNPATLTRLEERFSFATMIGASGKTGEELRASSPAYRAIIDAVTRDVHAIASTDRASGKGFAFSHRLFDERWLGSSDVRFELTGIANRIDLEHRGGCGEIHFVYRLAYTTKSAQAGSIDSRLPFTANVLVPIPDDGAKCSTVAREWLDVRPDDAAGSLLGGPLARLPKPARVEINYQVVRWPSKVRPDMGGHAEYVLRAFQVSSDTLEEIPLDDTPRTDLDATERADLLRWVGENLEAIDRGAATVPARFLARTTKSVAPRPAGRLANQPFSALLSESDLRALPLATTETVRSPGALLQKLDGLTCQGCHQSRGIAGFHLLGEERNGTLRLNALEVGASPHLVDAAKWRRGYLESVARREARPLRLAPARAADRPGRYGDHCTLGRDPGFAGWTCKSGLTCKRVDDDVLGRCLPPDGPDLGDACEESTIRSSLDSHTDRVTTRELVCKGGATCRRSDGGFPDGICEKRCEKLGQPLGQELICAGVPFGTGALGGFNNCLFTLKRPFPECLADDTRPTASRACDEDNPCRDDFVCARIYVKPARGETPVEPMKGACMPPYFVFQGRVDGHVLAMAK